MYSSVARMTVMAVLLLLVCCSSLGSVLLTFEMISGMWIAPHLVEQNPRHGRQILTTNLIPLVLSPLLLSSRIIPILSLILATCIGKVSQPGKHCQAYTRTLTNNPRSYRYNIFFVLLSLTMFEACCEEGGWKPRCWLTVTGVAIP